MQNERTDPTHGTDIAEAEALREATRLIGEGRALLDSGDLDGAIAIFDEATGRDPMSGAAWNDLAVALYQRGDRDMAIGCFYTAMKVDPTFADAAVNLATLLAEAGRPWDGVPALRSVLFHDPENDAVRGLLAGLGVGGASPRAVVVMDPTSSVGRVVDACLGESGYRTIVPDPAQVAAVVGSTTEVLTEEQAWTIWLAAVRPDSILIDPTHPSATLLRAAAANLGATVAVLGEDLPTAEPLVALASELTEQIPVARQSWDDVDRPTPPISVLIQVTHLAHTINILDRLATQDLAPGLFEVIVVDRSWGEPATSLVEAGDYDFDLKIVRAEGAGLGHARNLAVEQARGRWITFFDEEARPHPTNLRGHLAAQALSRTPRAVLGAFTLHPNLIDNSLRKLFTESNLLYAQPTLQHGSQQSGAAFRANNLSVPRAEVIAVGGFDVLFSTGCEDTDLGLRLEARFKMPVCYDQTLASDTDYAYTIADYQIEQLIRGWACTQLARKHNAPAFLVDPERESLTAEWFTARRAQAETQAPQAQELASRVMSMCHAEEPYRKTDASEIIEDVVRVIGAQAFYRGVAIARSGFRLEDERMPGTLTYPTLPVVVRPGGDLTATLNALAATEGDLQVFVPEPVDDAPLPVTVGSTADALATGSAAIAWIDAGTTPAPTWRTELLTALEAWPDFGAAEPETIGGNQPSAPSMIVMVRPLIQAIGDRLTECLSSPRLTTQVEGLGFQHVRVVAAPSDVATETSETTETTETTESAA